MLLAEIIVHRPVDILARLQYHAAHLILEAVKRLGLLRAVR